MSGWSPCEGSVRHSQPLAVSHAEKAAMTAASEPGPPMGLHRFEVDTSEGYVASLVRDSQPISRHARAGGIDAEDA
jgi:hypothetical protein